MVYPKKKNTFACFYTIDHTQSYKGRLLPQWLSQFFLLIFFMFLFIAPYTHNIVTMLRFYMQALLGGERIAFD